MNAAAIRRDPSARLTSVLLALFLVCLVALVLTAALLVLTTLWVRFASRVAGLALLLGTVFAAGGGASRLWSLRAGDVRWAEALLLVTGLVVIAATPRWNPVGQVFFGVFLASAVAYLAFGADTTLFGGLSPVAAAASAGLWLLELAALVLAASFTFEGCDATCRVRHTRPPSRFDPAHLPMVSLQVAAYNEPPDMLIDTIRSLEGIDYPNFEIVVVDNNTKDPAVWQPVRDYCRDRASVRFVHVDPWPGFKSGALNLALAEHTDPRAELIGIVDADYQIDPGWLRATAGYFVDPRVAFVQTPQDYREYETDEYLRACYDAYHYFFAVTMPCRNERNSIIFAGTMGLVRRSTLQEVGGWDEWCITEDAELSLRMLRAGYEGVYVAESYGRGIMPLTFATLKSQRFRWAFGGMQILRMHWRDLVPWNRDPDNHLTAAQRADYLIGNLQWTNDLVYFCFTVALLASAFALYGHGATGLRPLYGAAVLLPIALIVSGLVRALWALRVKAGIGWKRAWLAFANWLSLSWTVALACVEGLSRERGTFLRTPKTDERNRVLAALWSARTESLWALALWSIGIVALLEGRGTPFFLGLLLWQGAVYATAPYMSWLNQHTKLTPELERRRRTELRRERVTIAARYTAGAVAMTAIIAGVGGLVGLGGSHPGHPRNPFTAAHAPAPARAPAPRNRPTTTAPGSPPATSRGGTTSGTRLPAPTSVPPSSSATTTTGAVTTTVPPTTAPTTTAPTTTVPATAPPAT